jgi:alpha-galactosidase
LIGCDISKLDDFTLNLLSNDEVIELNQDPLGKQAQQALKTTGYQVWIKEMEDGSRALGIFNTTNEYNVVRFYWNNLGLPYPTYSVRDVWRQKDLGNFASMFATKVPPHGVTLIRIKKLKIHHIK